MRHRYTQNRARSFGDFGRRSIVVNTWASVVNNSPTTVACLLHMAMRDVPWLNCSKCKGWNKVAGRNTIIFLCPNFLKHTVGYFEGSLYAKTSSTPTAVLTHYRRVIDTLQTQAHRLYTLIYDASIACRGIEFVWVVSLESGQEWSSTKVATFLPRDAIYFRLCLFVGCHQPVLHENDCTSLDRAIKITAADWSI